jgi:hypothetical protein
MIMGKTLREMTGEVREVNIEKGWRTVRNSWGDYVALLHTEISEMLEAYRDHRLADATPDKSGDMPAMARIIAQPKPEGVGSEAADVLIRLLDMADVYGFPVFDMDCELADVDPLWPVATSGTFGGWIAWLHWRAAKLHPFSSSSSGAPLAADRFAVPLMLRALVAFCERWDIDLAAEYQRKIAYNRTRAYQHGGRTLADTTESNA